MRLQNYTRLDHWQTQGIGLVLAVSPKLQMAFFFDSDPQMATPLVFRCEMPASPRE